MQRRTVPLSVLATLAFGPTMLSSEAAAQSLKEQIVGSWTLVSAIDVHADGSKTDPWGADPKGAYMFGADGRFTQMLMRSDLPKLQSRFSGSADQHKALAQGVVAMYGSYTVDEAQKTINVKFEGSTFAAFNGTEGKRIITSINADQFTSMNPATSTGTRAESIWKRAK